MPWGPHMLADGSQVSTDNVLVIKAKQNYGKIFHRRGHDEPLHDIINAKGKFYYFNRGRYASGTWRKARWPSRSSSPSQKEVRSRWRQARPLSNFPTPRPRFASRPDSD